MAEFSELIKDFDKIRDYMHDFYIYGFKSRKDFSHKSSRTYDNEKRRIESYVGDYIKWNTKGKNKKVFISVDSSKISSNPLYAVWKSKSFTANDIMLHFYMIDILKYGDSFTADELAAEICHKSDVCFDTQTVRIKANEYVKNELFTSSKKGKALYYGLSQVYVRDLSTDYENILDAIKYYQESAPLGVVGDYILEGENKNNDIFIFKHHFLVHTLEDKVLLDILSAMMEKSSICFINESRKTGRTIEYYGVPLKIFVSSATGRRFLTIYNLNRKRFVNHRLDYIKSMKTMDKYEEYDMLKEKLTANLDKCWGVSFGDNSRGATVRLKLYIDEKTEAFIIKRLLREGKGGIVERVDNNVYLYSKEVFDANEMLPWVKSFIGRILSFECTNKLVENKFYADIKRMELMYGEE